jgi:hypothetical protein
VLYSDTDSVFAAYKKNVINENHGEIFWDPNKKDTIIKKAVFVSAKTYAVQYENENEIVKIKGFDTKDVSFSEIETNFYNSESELLTKNITILRKKKFTLQSENINKMLDLHNYDKRIFDEKKKTTTSIYRNLL